MLIESCFENIEINDLIENLPAESFWIVKPKHIDGSQVMQVFIELSEVVLPSAISAISAYLVATRNNPTITIKFSDKDKLEVKIKGKLNDKKLQGNQLYKYLVKLMKKQAKGK